jgi:predicted helicase
MARQAHMIRNLIVAAFEKEPEGGSLHAQLVAFRDNLIPDLSVEQFADMYAQTLAYGLFAARCTSKNGASFTRLDAAINLPKTNPFLRKLFQYIAGYDLDDRIAWLVDDLAQVLAQADMEAVLKDFGKRTAKEDPVVHFYETFLKEYDPKIRELRGVYYTPEPVVSYIVRSIDHLLKTRFNKPQGLADDKTLILDPAVGTATFLYMVINEVYQAIAGKGQQGLWNNYVAEKLLPRIFGFELLMAPYAVAHLKLGLLLQETKYQFKSDQRLGIYLTNTLEEAIKRAETLFARWITEEANAAAKIKKEEPIMVVLGNPPYSGISANRSEIEETIQPGQKYIDHLKLQVVEKENGEKMVYWSPVEVKATSRMKKRIKTFIGRLIEDYKIIDGDLLKERKHWLQDDYVKFIRFGQWRIERTGQGILSFITNHAYLDNPTFRGMRQSLMNAFTDIYILNLHGNVKKKEVAPDGSKDENVFDIQQGVAIGIFIKEGEQSEPAKVRYADLWGLRGEYPLPQPGTKYNALSETDISTTEWIELRPNSPFYFFVPLQEDFRSEYEQGWKVTDIFNTYSSGITCARDKFVIDADLSQLRKRIEEFGSNRSDEDIRSAYNLNDTRGWSLADARGNLRRDEKRRERFTEILYRPFDSRHIYYSPYMVDWPREEVMYHILRGNMVLLSSRPQSPSDFTYVFCAKRLTDQCTASNKSSGGGNCYSFPLYLYLAEGEMQFEEGHRRPNLNAEFIKTVSDKLGLTFVEDGKGDLEKTFGPEDIFNYAYAVFHSPTYRSRYAEFLKIDFPRLPLTSDKELFKSLATKGAVLVSLHLLESPLLEQQHTQTKFDVSGSNVVEKVTYNEIGGRVYINKEQYFEGVPLKSGIFT